MTRANLQLSEHFWLSEFVRSQTATRLSIDNWPDDPVLVERLRALCLHVLEPVRAHFGRPVVITSGYRCPALNAQTPGSADTSQHLRAEAADHEVPGVSNSEVAGYIRDELPFDQLILEGASADDPAAGWVHVSFREGARRGEVLTATFVDGRARYQRGLVA